MTHVKIALLGPHRGATAAWASFLTAADARIEIVFQAAADQAGVAAAISSKPDLIVMEFQSRALVPELLSRASARGSSPAVILLSADVGQEYVDAALACGAQACLLRSRPEDLLAFTGLSAHCSRRAAAHHLALT